MLWVLQFVNAMKNTKPRRGGIEGRLPTLLCGLIFFGAAICQGAEVELELQRSGDLQDWVPVVITPELLTKEGKVRQSIGAGSGFFRQHITEAETPTVSADQRVVIENIIDAALAANEIPGIVFGIKFPGQEPVVIARGVNDFDTENPMQEEARFRIGSASKTFIGMAALRLIQQGQLGFEQTVSHYLPESVLSNYDRDEITIRMLLRHTSGINNYTNIIYEWFFPYIEDRTRVWTDTELVELIDSRYADSTPDGGKVFDPGQGWYYSNTNTVLLGMIIEEITGETIGEHIIETFLTPLGLVHTVYPTPGESVIPGTAMRGFVNWADYTGETSLSTDFVEVTNYDASGVGAAGAMISTAADLCSWVEAIARSDELIGDYRRGHIDWRYFTSFSGGGEDASSGSYGMNLAHEPDPNNHANYFIVGHRGQIAGYDTAMMYLPEQEVAVVLACNRSLLVGEGLPLNALEVALNAIIGILYPEMIADNQLPASGSPMAPARMTEAEPRVPFFEFRGALNEYP